MAFEQKDALFKNDDKAEGDNRPNAKGRCKIDGKDYFVSAWMTVSQTGIKHQSLAFKPVEENGSAGKAKSHPAYSLLGSALGGD